LVEDPRTPPAIRDDITDVRRRLDVGRASLLLTQADTRLASGSFDGLRAAILAVRAYGRPSIATGWLGGWSSSATHYQTRGATAVAAERS